MSSVAYVLCTYMPLTNEGVVGHVDAGGFLQVRDGSPSTHFLCEGALKRFSRGKWPAHELEPAQEISLSCGTCGYPLKLCSSNRSSLSIGADYQKETKKGTISFLSIDESRFKLLDELRCGLYCESPTTWRLHRLRTKLLCGQCEAVIGHVYEDRVPSLIGCAGFETTSESGPPGQKRFWVKIRALQPDQDLEDDIPSISDQKDE